MSVIHVEFGGTEHRVEGSRERSSMQLALDNGVPGLLRCFLSARRAG